jgi:hypothetical protein
MDFGDSVTCWAQLSYRPVTEIAHTPEASKIPAATATTVRL